MERPIQPFRVNSKSFFLTWPRCDLPKETVFEHLQQMQAIKICVASELHADGFPHVHALVLFSAPRNVTSASYFDIQSFHPNIQSAKSVKSVLGYVRKGNNFLIN